VAVLSSILSWAIQIGYLDSNPCNEVKRNAEHSRSFLPSKEQFIAVRERAGPYIAVLMDFAYVSGARRGDCIGLRRDNLTGEGVVYVPHKTKDTEPRPRLIPWTPSVRSVIDQALALQTTSGRISPYVFISPRTLQWKRGAIDNAWHRLQAGFHFHDIRAMAATEHEDIRDAQVMLAHSGETTTAVYRRGVVRVKPVSLLED
jgi:integrase